MKEFYGNSWIEHVSFDETIGKMRITMNGKTYDFCGVPENVFDEFENSASHGTYYNKNIKGEYSC